MVERLKPPKIEGAPGLVWRFHKHSLEARWQARWDLVKRGFPLPTYRLWMGRYENGLPGEIDIARFQDICTKLQNEMLLFGAGGVPVVEFDGTVAGLIASYKTDPLSGYKKLRHHSRLNYNSLLKRLEDDLGKMRIEEIRARTIHEHYGRWRDGGKITMAHSLVGMLRTITSFGTAFLEDDNCTRVSVILSKLRFENGKPRTSRLTPEQFESIVAQAHSEGLHSIAFANSFQWDGILRQKDAIGEWVPVSEPGVLSDVISGNQKWGRGILWQEIDDALVLHHVTSKKQKLVHIPLRMAPNVLRELSRIAGCEPTELTRDKLPKSGPVIVSEKTNMPWSAFSFRIDWRRMATAIGIPKNVRNMDTRSGAISHGIESGARLENLRHAATHSDISQTQDYDRSQEKSTILVMEARFAKQNKSGT